MQRTEVHECGGCFRLTGSYFKENFLSETADTHPRSNINETPLARSGNKFAFPAGIRTISAYLQYAIFSTIIRRRMGALTKIRRKMMLKALNDDKDFTASRSARQDIADTKFLVRRL